jgi:hypothetical protein
MIIVGIIVLISVIGIVGMDIYLTKTKGFEGTISWWMWVNSAKYPIIPAGMGLIIGILFGHFFWDQALDVTVNSGCGK